MRWCFNKYGITRSGARFIQQAVSIRASSLHNFFTYYANGVALPSNAETMIFDEEYSATQPKLPEGYWMEILKAMKVIGTNTIWNQPVTADEIRMVLADFYKWLGTNEGVKEIPNHLDFGFLYTETEDDFWVRWKVGNRADFIKLDSVRIKAKELNECEGCGETLACVTFRDGPRQMLCNKCFVEVNASDDDSCEHAECQKYGCPHSIAWMSTDFPVYGIEEEFYD